MSSKYQSAKRKNVTVKYSDGMRVVYSVPENLNGKEILKYLEKDFGNRLLAAPKFFDHFKYVDLRNGKAYVVKE